MSAPKLNWKKLYFGKVSPQEVQEAVRDAYWQKLRRAMKGMSLSWKYTLLEDYLDTIEWQKPTEHERRMAQVRVTNYVTALSREGLIKPSDYR